VSQQKTDATEEDHAHQYGSYVASMLAVPGLLDNAVLD